MNNISHVIRKKFAAELISKYIKTIDDDKKLKEVYKYLDDVFTFLKVKKSTKIEFMEYLMEISRHNNKYLNYIKNRKPNNNPLSIENLKQSLAESTVTQRRKEELEEIIDTDIQEIILILNPSYILFMLKNSRDDEIKIKAGKFIEKIFSVKRTAENKYFYFNDGKYEELTNQDLGVLFKEKFSLNLMDKHFKELMSCIQGKEVPNNNVWNFNNCLYDTSERIVLNCDKEDIFTIKNAGLNDKLTDEIISLDYIENVDIEPNFNEKEITLTQKVIQEILIPKYEKDNTDLYYDFLQRIGASFNKKNKHKSLTLYLNKEGDNAKSFLLKLLSYIFNSNCVSVIPESLKDDKFVMVTTLKNKNVIIFDELDKNSFKFIFTMLKVFSSGKTSNSQRNFNSDTVSTSSDMGMLWMATNIVPYIDISSKANLRRLDVLIPPNQFIKTEGNLKANQYPMIEDIDELVMKDMKGLSWLASAALKAYQEMINNNEEFRCKQTPEETLNIILDKDPLSVFMEYCIKETGKNSDTVTNKEIVEAFEQYLENSNKDMKINPSMIGNKIKKVYPNVVSSRTSKGKYYKGLQIVNIDEWIRNENE